MRNAILYSILTAVFLSGTANAALVRVDWEGEVSRSYLGVAAKGDTISGSFTYDNTTESPPGFTGSYRDNHDSSFSLNGLNGTTSGNQILVYNDLSDTGDQFDSRNYSGSYTGDLVAGYQVSQIFVRFTDSTGTVFSDRSLPETLNSADFDFRGGSRIDLDGNGGSVQFNVTGFTATIIPVPAAVWLFSSALAGLGWVRRRQLQ